MDKPDSVPLSMTCNCYFAKLGIKHAYSLLPDKNDHQTFLIGEVRFRNLLILSKHNVFRKLIWRDQ